MKKVVEIIISPEEVSDFYNIIDNVFWPLTGFMNHKDFKGVVKNMHLSNGEPWTIPITLSIPESKLESVKKSSKAILVNSEKEKIGMIFVEDVFKIDYNDVFPLLFKTKSHKHPGVLKEMMRSPYRIGGRIALLKRRPRVAEYLSPADTKQIFQKKGWKRIVGFQTRNPIHKAHEYLQRVSLEFVDGLFIQPLVGWKKKGDFSNEAVISSYKYMIKNIYPSNRVLLGVLDTPMRYAGPREAVFHAIIRRNYGCTHFIIGRDHAGVGNFYGKYEAHRLIKQLDNLGIRIFTLHEPYYCKKCGFTVSRNNCRHINSRDSISGTKIRKFILNNKTIPIEYMRKEISMLLIRLNKENKCFV